MIYDNYAILDVETTGSTAAHDRIIEIGIMRIEKNKIVGKLDTLLNPEIPISPFIENLTGISDKDLENAPTFHDIKSDLADLLEGAIFVAHNARFDYSFLRHEFKRIGITYQAKQLCSVKLSRHLFPNFSHHNLDSIIERFEISCKRRHRAMDDAFVIWEFLQKIEESLPSEKIEKAIRAIIRKPSLPPLLRKGAIDDLPEGAGVYMFYGKSEIPLYIGKSINIKERVISHFMNDTESSTEMEISQQVERIDHIVTGGELSALILESELIKKMQPIYNRKLRYARRLTILKKEITKEGYFTLNISTCEQIQSSDFDDILGIFKSQKSAKEHLQNLVREYSLCQKMLGLQKISGPCFSYHLEKCRGACIKKEDPQVFNARFILAFSLSKLSSWPFDGPIIIKEGSDIEEALVFDRWCYLGKLDEYNQDELQIDTALSDYDVYKILRAYLKNPKNYKKITTVKNSKFLQTFCRNN